MQLNIKQTWGRKWKRRVLVEPQWAELQLIGQFSQINGVYCTSRVSATLCGYQYLSMEQVANTCSVTTITYSLHRYHRFHQQVLYLFIEYGIFCPGEGTGTCSFSRWDLLAQLVGPVGSTGVPVLSTRLYLLIQPVPVCLLGNRIPFWCIASKNIYYTIYALLYKYTAYATT